MKIAILQFPGSNCERETALAVKRAGMEPHLFLWNADPAAIANCDGFIIIGGFSFEDRSRAGIIAALSPVMNTIAEQSLLGKPILGICNGAQILVESGLVPGLENNKLGLALTENKRMVAGKIIGTGYYNAWVSLKLSMNYQRNAFTKYLTPASILSVPIAHAEGRFVISPALLQEIQHQGLNVLQYCDANGVLENAFPINPNGSIDNIAAISNKAGNILAIMPHPERTPNGDAIFHSMRDFIVENNPPATTLPLCFYPRPTPPTSFKPRGIVQNIALTITDNAALTVQQALHQLGIDVEVKRYQQWEMNAEANFNAITATNILFNARKEKVIALKTNPAVLYILIRPKEDQLAAFQLAQLQTHCSNANIFWLNSGVLWQFSSKNVNINTLKDEILNTNILHNPYADDSFLYVQS